MLPLAVPRKSVGSWDLDGEEGNKPDSKYLGNLRSHLHCSSAIAWLLSLNLTGHNPTLNPMCSSTFRNPESLAVHSSVTAAVFRTAKSEWNKTPRKRSDSIRMLTLRKIEPGIAPSAANRFLSPELRTVGIPVRPISDVSQHRLS